MNANSTLVNRDRQIPLDLAPKRSSVWQLLHDDVRWRAMLEETPLPCRVTLVRQRLSQFQFSMSWSDTRCIADTSGVCQQFRPWVES